MGTTVRYCGPFDSVEVPEADMIVERLKPVELDTELAKNLLLQEDNWERPPKPRATSKPKESAPPTDETPEPETPATTEREGE